MGMKMYAYWLMNYAFNYLLYTVVVVVFVAVELAFRVRFFTQTRYKCGNADLIVHSPLAIFWLFFLWGHALISLAFFLTVFFKNQQTASCNLILYVFLLYSVVGYLLVIVSVIAGEIFNATGN